MSNSYEPHGYLHDNGTNCFTVLAFPELLKFANTEHFNVARDNFFNVAKTELANVAKNNYLNVTKNIFFNITKSEYFNTTKSGFCNVTETDLSIAVKPVLESLVKQSCRASGRQLYQKRLQHMFFVKFAKFLKTPILQNICERLLRIFGIFRKVLELKQNLLIIRDQSSLNDPILLLIVLSTLLITKSCNSIGQEGKIITIIFQSLPIIQWSLFSKTKKCFRQSRGSPGNSTQNVFGSNLRIRILSDIEFAKVYSTRS